MRLILGQIFIFLKIRSFKSLNKIFQVLYCFIFIIIISLMKKNQGDKPIVAISLSAKKASNLRPQSLFTPYKIEWKNRKGQSESYGNKSKTFFTSMKNQLSSLKHDVEKLIKKEENQQQQSLKREQNQIQQFQQVDSIKKKEKKHIRDFDKENIEVEEFEERLTLVRKTDRKQGPSKELENKLKSLERVLQEEKEKVSLLTNQLYKIKKEQQEKEYFDEHYKKQIQVQKNIIKELKKQGKFFQQEKFNLEKTIKFLQDQGQKLKYQLDQAISQKQEEETYFQQEISSISIYKQIQNDFETIKEQNKELHNHNTFLENKIEALNQKLNLITCKYQEKEVLSKQLQGRINRLSYQFYQKKEIDQKIKQFSEKIFLKDNENLKLSHQISSIKIENEQYKSLCSEQKVKISSLQQEIERKSRDALISRKQEVNSMKSLGKQFQEKINQLYEENYQLKNVITKNEATIKKLQFQKNIMKQELQVYEEDSVKRSKSKEQKNLEQEIQKLMKERDELIEDYEYKLMKKENHFEQMRRVDSNSENNQCVSIHEFNKILKEQLSENQDLKLKLKELSSLVSKSQGEKKELQFRVSFVNNELSAEKIKNMHIESKQKHEHTLQDSLKEDINLLRKKYESLNSVLESKNNQIKAKDDFIHKVLIEKIGKRDDQNEAEYLMERLNSIYK